MTVQSRWDLPFKTSLETQQASWSLVKLHSTAVFSAFLSRSPWSFLTKHWPILQPLGTLMALSRASLANTTQQRPGDRGSIVLPAQLGVTCASEGQDSISAALSQHHTHPPAIAPWDKHEHPQHSTVLCTQVSLIFSLLQVRRHTFRVCLDKDSEEPSQSIWLCPLCSFRDP